MCVYIYTPPHIYMNIWILYLYIYILVYSYILSITTDVFLIFSDYFILKGVLTMLYIYLLSQQLIFN